MKKTFLSALLLVVSSSTFAFNITEASNPDGFGNPTASSLYSVGVTDADINSSFVVNWLLKAGDYGAPEGALAVDLEASAKYTVTGFTTNTLSLDIEISNDTDLSAYPGTNSAILSFGFGIDPNVDSYSLASGSVFDMAEIAADPSQTYPGGFKQIDVCIFSEGCNGGDVNSGLQASSSDTLSIDLHWANGIDTPDATLLYFPLKFQGTWGSYELAGCVDGCTPPPPPPPEGNTPAPATLALMGIGLVGFAAARRRKTA